MTLTETNIKETKVINWEQNTHVVEVPQFKSKDYTKLLKKLKRFSKTIGFPEPISKEISLKKLYIIYEDNSIISSTYDIVEARKLLNGWSGRTIRQVNVQVFELTIVDNIRPIEEWEILGTIDYKDSIVKPAPGKEIPMDLLKDLSLSGNSNCDHCNKNIYRNKTVFVKNTDSGEINHIGGTCTKYYLGMDYTRILNYVESVYVMESLQSNDFEEWGSYGSNIEKLYSITDLVKYYIWHTKHNGHMSKKQSEAYNLKVEDTRNHRESTGSIVSDVVKYVSYRPNVDGLEEYEREDILNDWMNSVSEFNTQIESVTDIELQEVLDFVESKKLDNNFMFNVSNKITEGSVNDRLVGYITGACSFFFSVKLFEENKRKMEEKQLEESENSPSTHIGEIDTKYGFENVEVTNISGYEGSFGWTNIYTMVDQKGNVIIKFGTINDRFIVSEDTSIVVGTKLSFTSPVSEHTEFRGINQTKIGRLSKFNPKLKY